MKYKSKIDHWLVLGLIIILGLTVYRLYPLLNTPFEVLPWSQVIIMFLAGVVLPIWLTTSTWYRITDSELHIRSAFFNWHIPLTSIDSLHNSRSWLSAPALSLDRIMIQFDSGQVAISPEDKSAFLAELNRRRTALGSPALTL